MTRDVCRVTRDVFLAPFFCVSCELCHFNPSLLLTLTLLKAIREKRDFRAQIADDEDGGFQIIESVLRRPTRTHMPISRSSNSFSDEMELIRQAREESAALLGAAASGSSAVSVGSATSSSSVPSAHVVTEVPAMGGSGAAAAATAAGGGGSVTAKSSAENIKVFFFVCVCVSM